MSPPHAADSDRDAAREVRRYPLWFKHRAWIAVAWLLCLVNLASVWFAARPAEPWHATIHALLAVLFGLGAQRLAARPRVEQSALM
jgi:hypothetical protein